MTDRCAPLFATALVFAGCATAPPPPKREALPPPTITDEQLYAPVIVRGTPASFEVERPPPPRRRREYLLAETEYVRTAKEFTRGPGLHACAKLCRQDEFATPSEDHRWTWMLRCQLDRNVREEPIVACREVAVEPRKAEREVEESR